MVAGLAVGAQTTSEPAEAYATMAAEGQTGFQGFRDPMNIDVCWNPTLPPIWVEATRRALLAWDDATTWVRFRSLRPVSSIAYPVGCDVFVNNELSDYDTTRPGIDPVTQLPILLNEPDGIVSDAESNTRASGGRSSQPSGTGSSTTWSTFEGYVKVNSRATQMQGRTEKDLLSFQSTMLHELGHVLGLEHSLAADSVMTKSGNTFHAPQADDIAGLSFIYSKVTLVQPAAAPFVTTDPVTSMTEAYWPVAALPSEDLPSEDPPVATTPVETPAGVPSTSATTPNDEAATDAGTDDATSGSPTASDTTDATDATEPEPSDDLDPHAGDADAEDGSKTDASPTRTVVAPPSALSIVALEAGGLLCLLALILLVLRRKRRNE
ncbi:hypothetical protein BH09ACT1_BH09ACT1_16960 [soil metagenome]